MKIKSSIEGIVLLTILKFYLDGIDRHATMILLGWAVKFIYLLMFAAWKCNHQ